MTCPKDKKFLLSADDNDDDEVGQGETFLLSHEEENSQDGRHEQVAGSQHCGLYVLSSILLLSGVLNVFQGVWIFGDNVRLDRYRASVSFGGPIYHESIKTVDQALYSKGSYEYTLNQDIFDKQMELFDPDKGVVVLPKGQPNVLPSKQFPWDATKEIYVLSGYHSLHSLKLLWSELHKLSGDVPLTSHVLHSLNVLWQDTICTASTDPMTIDPKLGQNRVAIEEAGQMRECRDWQEVEEFRMKHSACFKGMGGARKDKHMIEEWQFCPEGSPYQKVIDKYNANAG